MAPIWSSYLEKNRTSAMLYVVDASSPEKVGAATIHLIDILEHSRAVVPGLPLMIVFRHIIWIHYFHMLLI